MAGETTKVLLTSTPLGYNHFWKFWNDSLENKNGFVNLQIPYWKIPGRDEAWAEEQKKVLGELKFNQEVLCTFLGSSNTLISSDKIARMSSKSFTFSKDNLDVLEAPEKDHFYFIAVDTSRGVGGDFSAFTVVDCTEYPFKVVAKFKDNKIAPLLYPDIIVKVAKDYNDAHILVEINDIGQQVADTIYNDIEYDNMMWVGHDSKYGQYLSSTGKSAVLGVRTTKHRGSFQADEGYHDDLIMSLVLFSWASNDPLFKDLMNANNRKALYKQKIVQIEEELTPFGLINDHQPEVYEVKDGDLWLHDSFQKDYQEFLKEHNYK
jgi:hypothetical protein